MATRTLLFYSHKDINRKFLLYSSLNKCAFPFNYLINFFAEFDQIVISNVPLYFNIIILKYCAMHNIKVKIIVDSILEPPHISLWKRWQSQSITGAYQLISSNVIHPLSSQNNFLLPKEIIKYMNNPRQSIHNKGKLCVGLTISNTPASNQIDEDSLLLYFLNIVKFLEQNKIDYLIRDRNDFFLKDKYLRSRIPIQNDSSLINFFDSITHLITVPGSLVLLAGLENIFVSQIILSNMFSNTPSAFLVTTKCRPSSWIISFINNGTPNHIFQSDYYSYLSNSNYSNDLDSFLSQQTINSNNQRFVLARFLFSMFFWDLRLLIKELYFLTRRFILFIRHFFL